MDKDNFCNLCSMQFGNKFVYDIHMSFVHKIVTQQDKSEKLTEVKGNYFQKGLSKYPHWLEEKFGGKIEGKLFKVTIHI